MKDDSAFPLIVDTNQSVFGEGLTKREWFAGLAMQTVISYKTGRYLARDLKNVTSLAVSIADALIAELEKDRK